MAVATYGCGPPGVPQTIDRCSLGTDTVVTAARILCDVFKSVRDCRFGIYVAGFDGEIARLFHVDIPSVDGTVPIPRLDYDGQPIGELRLWPVAPPQVANEIHIRVQQAGLYDPLSLVTKYVSDAHDLAPEDVGGDMVRVRITAASGAVWVQSDSD